MSSFRSSEKNTAQIFTHFSCPGAPLSRLLRRYHRAQSEHRVKMAGVGVGAEGEGVDVVVVVVVAGPGRIVILLVRIYIVSIESRSEMVKNQGEAR